MHGDRGTARGTRAIAARLHLPPIERAYAPLLGAVLHQGRMDVIHDLAYPLPVIVIAELLGIPSADRARFKQWSDSVVTGGSMGIGFACAERLLRDGARVVLCARGQEQLDAAIETLQRAAPLGQDAFTRGRIQTQTVNFQKQKPSSLPDSQTSASPVKPAGGSPNGWLQSRGMRYSTATSFNPSPGGTAA